MLEPDSKIWSKAKYNVLTLTGRSTILKRWPELNQFPEFKIDYGTHNKVHLNTESLLKYCLLFYQKNTLNIIEPNYMHRKRICAEWAGFEIDKKTGTFSDRLEDTIMGNNPLVNKLIARILQLSNDVLFQQAVVYESARHRYMMKLETGDEKNAKSIMDIIDKATDKLQEIEEKILKQDVKTQIKEELYHAIVVATLPTPEAIARAFKDGNIDALLDAPYDIEHPGIKVGKKRDLK